MEKRTVIAYFLFCIVLMSLVLRLYALTAGGYKSVSSYAGGGKTLILGETRGMIYDRNLSPLVNSQCKYLACVLPTREGIAAISEKLDESELEVYKAQLERGSLVTFITPSSGDYAGCADIAVIPVYERYTPVTAQHIIGYLSPDGTEGACGAELTFNELLKGYSGTVSAHYTTDALGRVLSGADAEMRNENYASSGGIVLTLDKSIQLFCEQSLTECGITKGAAVVIDVKSGEVTGCASAPVFDRDNLGSALGSADAPFLNRAFTEYTVGSVFKLVVAAAALENGIDKSFSYTCTGSTQKSGTKFLCHKHSGHGTLDMRDAFALSCNTYFIELACTVGIENVLEYAEKFGFGKAIPIFGDYVSDSGLLPELSFFDSEASVANLAFGQGNLLATPLQLAYAYLAAVNGGRYECRDLLRGYVDENGVFTPSVENDTERTIITSETSAALRELLENTVLTGSGKAAGSELFSSGGKTATAETGRYIDGREIQNCWYVGCFPAQSPEYVIAVLKEDGVSGSNDAAPVFKMISEKIYSSQLSE